MNVIDEAGGLLPVKATDKQIHVMNVCHGSPGTIPLFTLAAKIFPHMADRCIKTALQAGEATW